MAWLVVATRGRPGCETSVEGLLLMEESQSLVGEEEADCSLLKGLVCCAQAYSELRPAGWDSGSQGGSRRLRHSVRL